MKRGMEYIKGRSNLVFEMRTRESKVLDIKILSQAGGMNILIKENYSFKGIVIYSPQSGYKIFGYCNACILFLCHQTWKGKRIVE